MIRFVGQLRARNQGEQSDVVTGVAEQMLYSALRGEPMRGQFGEFDKGYAQFALLAELVSDLGVPGTGVSALLITIYSPEENALTHSQLYHLRNW